ncbi:MAG: family 10 glycosylhydrolase, partial [Fimbriiglobus sp.]|nr:family 10 glycosylhydrolase [Fimbriiglobus sp.]
MKPTAFALVVALVALPLLAADPQPVKREFRGVWVATVANIDWPSKPNLTEDAQKKEWDTICDRCVELKLNAVIFQVRPMCDALYKSELEPWSGFLSGTPGQDPGYDPLAYAIEAAHRRGLELHAWFNPYRAWHPSAKGEVPERHVVRQQPGWAKKYGKHYWLNPTNADAR